MPPTEPDGALTFARFAYPPNQLGYCGPDVQDEILQRVDARAGGPELRALARGFEGAWPYLQLIAAGNGIGDPLDARVVEAYWIGNRLLDRVGTAMFADSLVHRFAPALRSGTDRDRLLDPLWRGGVPHHGFHVFGVYPWVGLLRSGAVDQALHVLDRCRVRWGRITELSESQATVESRPLVWDGRHLELGAPRAELASTARAGYVLAPRLRVGEWCALHWDWVCEPLNRRRLDALRRYTRQQLDAVNSVRFPAPAAALA
ncbi:MAG TPA: DUF6390 family protein [Jatrophihabitans sp.]|nr:DUF6390 family protein [Jatrophihabitans sp.]